MPPAERPAVGQLRLELLAEIAVGATTRVDLCRSLGPPAAGELLAVKRLLPELRDDPVLSKRFLDEVWMTAALRHPNVVRVIGWGGDEQGSYLAVELVQGVSLARLMKTVFDTGEDFTERLAVYLALCVARGLGAAHDLRSDRGEPLSLVHRNLTPSNVLLGFQGDVKIADFGLAKAKQRLSTTTATSLPNRPSTHVSPEEIRGDRVDHRGDLFSLGVILFEILTRKLPWTGASDLETVQRIVREPAPDPLTLRPKLDRALARTLLRCLEKDPGERFSSAHEVANELDGWLYAHGWSEENELTLGRFVRRNAMRQMHWFERAIAGGARPETQRNAASFRPTPAPPAAPARAPKPGGEKQRAEVTQVERPARRRRADSAPPAGEEARASSPVAEPVGGAAGDPGPGATGPAGARPEMEFADPPTLFEEDSEEAPTLAMRRSDLPADFLARLRGGAASPAAKTEATPRPSPAEPERTAARSKGPPPLPTARESARPAPPSATQRPRTAPPAPKVLSPGKPTVQAMAAVPNEWTRALDRIQLEIETHRTTAASMRESAKQLLAAAEDEEAAGRRAEQALAIAKEAAALAHGGATTEAKLRLDEALRLADVQR